MSCLAVIPARGGSKRIPRKNIRNFLGKPIIAYSIEAALEAGIFDEVMVSTDDAEIAEVAVKNGASVPFFRSALTSSDMAGTAPVLIEVLEEYLKRGKEYEYVCCVYPCAPFVTASRLRASMEKLISESADSVVPVVRFSYPPQRGLVISNGSLRMIHPENYNVRSQDFEPLFHDTGQFYCFRSDALKAEGNLFCGRALPVVLAQNEVQDIDSEEDWLAAEVKYRILKGL